MARPPPLALSFPFLLRRPSWAALSLFRVLSGEGLECFRRSFAWQNRPQGQDRMKIVPGRYGCGGDICPLCWHLCLIGPAPLPFGHLRLLFKVEQVLETTPLYPF